MPPMRRGTLVPQTRERATHLGLPDCGRDLLHPRQHTSGVDDDYGLRHRIRHHPARRRAAVDADRMAALADRAHREHHDPEREDPRAHLPAHHCTARLGRKHRAARPPLPDDRVHRAMVGAWVAVTRYLGQGPEITIVFRSADGLEAGKTKIYYHGVDVGTVTAIRLSDDHQRVITTAQMAPRTDEFLVDDTQFWIVRPGISGANVTGLGTLISVAYIGLEIGHARAEKTR